MERITVFMRNRESAFWKKGMFSDGELRSSVRILHRRENLGFCCCATPIIMTSMPKFATYRVTAPFNNMRTLKFNWSVTDKCVFRYRARGNQIVVHSSDNEQDSAEAVSREDPPTTWLTAAKNAFVGWAFNFRVRVLLKSAVRWNELFYSWKSRIGILKENNVFRRASSEVLTAVLWESRAWKLFTCQLFIQSILQATQASIYLTWCNAG